MPTIDPRIDAYIRKSQPFAQPILEHLRALVHKACPDAKETMKWGMPYFEYSGQLLCSMAAFKQHAVFGFWKAPLMKDPVLMENARTESAMGHLGRITSLADLPKDSVLLRYIKEAAKLNETGAKVEQAPKLTLKVPGDLRGALAKNKAAKEHFAAFTPGKKRGYVEWLEEAKTEATRAKRLATAVEWIAEGKAVNWKYARKA